MIQKYDFENAGLDRNIIYGIGIVIYFDNAATTIRKPQCVIDALTGAMCTLGNSGRGFHEGSLGASRIVYETRELISSFFSLSDPTRVIFTSNATEALNTVILGIFDNGDHIISTDSEHNSVLRPLYCIEDGSLSRSVLLDFVPCDASGDIDYAAFEALRKPNTKAVVMQHGSNLTGNIFDVERVGRWAHEHGILMIVDVSQTAGIIPIDMQKMNIDILCFTGHKGLMGPQGTGGICISSAVDKYIRPLKMGGTGVQTYLKEQPSQYPTHLEAGTLNAHGIAGLKAGIEFINSVGIENIYEHELKLLERFMTHVSQIEGVCVYGNVKEVFEKELNDSVDADFNGNVNSSVMNILRGKVLPIVALNYKDMPSDELGDWLFDQYEIATRAGAHCAPRLHEALGTKNQGAVRFSFGYFNTIDEIESSCKYIRKIAEVKYK